MTDESKPDISIQEAERRLAAVTILRQSLEDGSPKIKVWNDGDLTCIQFAGRTLIAPYNHLHAAIAEVSPRIRQGDINLDDDDWLLTAWVVVASELIDEPDVFDSETGRVDSILESEYAHEIIAMLRELEH